MVVFGVMLVRNAVDLVRINLLHHLGLGLERILVLDNGSSDGTRERVALLARDLPIELSSDDGPFFHEELVNGLVAEARLQGADWVLPIDADEFFVAAEPLPRLLAGSPAGALRIQLVNFVQRRWRRRTSERALLTMDHRPARTTPPSEARHRVHTGGASLVEVEWEPKLIVRLGGGTWLRRGAHGVCEADGPIEDCDEIVCLHAPLQCRSRLAARIAHGRRADAAGTPAGVGWQNRDMLTNGFDRDRLWRANSNRHGQLDIGGEPHALVPDRRLADAVAPYVPGRARAALSRLHWRVHEDSSPAVNSTPAPATIESYSI